MENYECQFTRLASLTNHWLLSSNSLSYEAIQTTMQLDLAKSMTHN